MAGQVEARGADWQAGYQEGLDDAKAWAWEVQTSEQGIRDVLGAVALLFGDRIDGNVQRSLRSPSARTLSAIMEICRLRDDHRVEQADRLEVSDG